MNAHTWEHVVKEGAHLTQAMVLTETSINPRRCLFADCNGELDNNGNCRFVDTHIFSLSSMILNRLRSFANVPVAWFADEHHPSKDVWHLYWDFQRPVTTVLSLRHEGADMIMGASLARCCPATTNFKGTISRCFAIFILSKEQRPSTASQKQKGS